MPQMTDPMEGLRSFQEHLPLGGIDLERSRVDPKLLIHADNPTGDAPRMTFVRLEGKKVSAFVIAAVAGHENGKPVFQFGYAVPEEFRGQGRAKEILPVVLRDMAAGFRRAGIPAFYIEAVIGKDNIASQKVAETIFPGVSPAEGNDSLSGAPCYQYIRLIEV